MRNYLIEKKEDIKELKVFPREEKVEKSKSFALSIVGPRRAGKTFFLYYIIKKFRLKDDEYVFINFEDDEIRNLERRVKVNFLNYHREIYGKDAKFIFLDEIQNLKNWSSFLYSLIEKKRYFLFVTGSSSKLLSKEISTELRGRSITHVIFPFSFREFLNVRNIQFREPLSLRQISKIKYELKNYLDVGGFPQVALGEIKKEDFVREYVNVVLYKDLVERFGIENVDAMRFLIFSVIQSNAKEFSINKIYKQAKNRFKISNKTLYSYSTYLEEVFFSFYLHKFHWSIRKSLVTIPKVYINDSGIFSQYFPNSVGRKMETVVFHELKKKELRNEIELYYLKIPGSEVDFLIKCNGRIKELINVTYSNSFDEINAREWRGLLKANELFKKDRPILRIITWDYEDERIISWFGKKGKIKFTPLWKWILDLKEK